MELREEQRRSGSDENHNGWGALDGPRKLVHFKDKGGAEENECEEEGCPLSLVRLVLLSVDGDGYFGNKNNDASHHWGTSLMPLRPPPSPCCRRCIPVPRICQCCCRLPKRLQRRTAMAWRGQFSWPPSPAAPHPPPSISTTTKGTSLPPPMQQWGGCGRRRMRGGAGLQQGEEDGGTSIVSWAWMRGRRWHWRHKQQQGAVQQQQGCSSCGSDAILDPSLLSLGS
jgi:hypothetical protein